MEELVKNSVKKIRKSLWKVWFLDLLFSKMLKSWSFPLSIKKLFNWFYTRKIIFNLYRLELIHKFHIGYYYNYYKYLIKESYGNKG